MPFYNDAENPPMFWPEDTAFRIPTTSATSGGGTATLGFAQQPAIGGITITGTNGVFSYNTAEQLKVNQKITISGRLSWAITNQQKFGVMIQKCLFSF